MNYELVDTILYTGEEGSQNTKLFVNTKDNSMWATQKIIAELFNVNKSTVSRNLKNIFDDGELDENSVVANFATTASDGKTYNTKIYNFDAIISVGYRVNSKQATHFRRWATKVLKEYMIKGFVLDEELLKNNGCFGVSYFPDLLEKIREIRSSERLFNHNSLIDL